MYLPNALGVKNTHVYTDRSQDINLMNTAFVLQLQKNYSTKCISEMVEHTNKVNTAGSQLNNIFLQVSEGQYTGNIQMQMYTITANKIVGRSNLF